MKNRKNLSIKGSYKKQLQLKKLAKVDSCFDVKIGVPKLLQTTKAWSLADLK